MRTLLAVFLLALPAFGNQSVVLTSTHATGVITIPDVSIFHGAAQQNQNFRVEARIHNFTIPSDSGHDVVLFNFGGLASILEETGWICVVNQIDDPQMFDYGTEACANANGHTDVVLRIVRNISANRMEMRLFDASTGLLIGGHCGHNGDSAVVDCIIRSGVPADMHGVWDFGLFLGGTSPLRNLPMAWFKVFSTVAPDPDNISGELTPADLVDFRFESNLTNVGTSRVAVTATYPGATYTVAPAYAPVCSAGTGQSVRAGSTLTLDGSNAYSRNGAPLARFAWQQISGPSKVLWSSHTAISPTVRGLVAGGYTFSLTVTDTDGVSAPACTVGDGAVSTDSNGVVITENTTLNHLLSPILMTGHTPWPWTDVVIPQTGDNMIALQSTSYAPFWRTTSTHGTVDVPPTTSGADILNKVGLDIVGHGTSFKADFCGGGTVVAANSPRLVIQYLNQFGERTYRPFNVGTCTDDTHMHVGSPAYMFSTTQTGLSYSIMNEDQMASWISQNGSANANYYDAVLAFYALYYQTGLPKYHAAAQNLADMWWESPGILNGAACWEGSFIGLGTASSWCLHERSDALMGLFLRAMERPSMWPGLLLFLDSLSSPVTYNLSNPVKDLREESARMAMVCTGAMFVQELGVSAPNLPHYQQFCADMVNLKWAPNVRPDGSIYNPQYENTSQNGNFPSAVTVTQNSRTVTLLSGTFDCPHLYFGTGYGARRFWAYYPNSDVGEYSGDPVSYAVDSCAGNTLTLHTPYVGTSHPDAGFALSLVGGTFVQPFMMGYWIHSLSLANEALISFGGSTNLTTAATARKLIAGATSWLFSKGYRPATNGLFYDRGGLMNDGVVGGPNGSGGCEPDPETSNDNGDQCKSPDAGIQNSRYLAGEVFGALSRAYSYSPDPTLKANIDDWYGKLWGGSGGPGADGNYLSGFYPVRIVKAKDFAFSFGWGSDFLWPATRIGGAATPAPRTYSIPFRLANFPNAARARVTLTNASGVSSSTVCTSSPCYVTPDARQGMMSLYKIEYLTSGDAVISAGDTIPLTVQP